MLNFMIQYPDCRPRLWRLRPVRKVEDPLGAMDQREVHQAANLFRLWLFPSASVRVCPAKNLDEWPMRPVCAVYGSRPLQIDRKIFEGRAAPREQRIITGHCDIRRVL